MRKIFSSISLFVFVFSITAQPLPQSGKTNMTPEMLLQLGRLSPSGISKDKKSVVYSVKTFSIVDNNGKTKYYSIPVEGGVAAELENKKALLVNNLLSPGGKYSLYFKEVKIKKVFGEDFYPDLNKSEVMIYDDLNYRHWDEWEDGSFSHVFMHNEAEKDSLKDIDIMPNEPYDCPQKPFGGDEDAIWSPDGQQIIYVTKKKYGKEYALSTNTDIYSYNIKSGVTTNLTKGMNGYDMAPAFSSEGIMAWESMKTGGNEADKNDIVVNNGNTIINLTEQWDGTVNHFLWSADGKKIFFTAPVDGTQQLFEVNYPGQTKIKPEVKQITKGDFDVVDFVGQAGNNLVVTRTDMNHALELYRVDFTSGKMTQLTHINDAIYNTIQLSRTEKRYITTTDGKQMLTWIIYPPNFDPTKKYPTLLYCQGGPQSALTQFYSYRWNFQLMAANGYIVVAPNRRGMPGHGVEWNAQISKNYGAQPMQDYLSAIDEVSKETFVDKDHLGCVGASFGGYSVFYLEGIHQKRFKTFIAHDGFFNIKGMYGSTEELWFVNWDFGGPYWQKDNVAAQKTYTQFDPINLVSKWDTPILIIHGGKDYRVPVEQGLEAFQAAQLQGIKSRLIILPNENHWVLHVQNALVWHRQFYKWLKETI